MSFTQSEVEDENGRFDGRQRRIRGFDQLAQDIAFLS
jgi:hypothetical protein